MKKLSKKQMQDVKAGGISGGFAVGRYATA